jgi:hypothetical protein
MLFVDLKIFFDRVFRDMIWWALRELRVEEEYIVSDILVVELIASRSIKFGAGESSR